MNQPALGGPNPLNPETQSGRHLFTPLNNTWALRAQPPLVPDGTTFPPQVGGTIKFRSPYNTSSMLPMR